MKRLDERRLLALWDLAVDRHPIDRALILLADVAAAPADLPIGQRDQRLLELRATLFGARIEATATCASCGQRLELAFTAEQALGVGVPEDGAIEASCAGLRLRLRRPTSRDLAAVADAPPDEAPRQLLERLLLSVDPPAHASAVVTEDVVAAAGDALRAASPASEILLETVCPECGASASLLFDPVTQVWSEIDAAARRLLWEAHSLALAYGWTEAETFALPASRRRRYLELVGA
jgi:hypothetical protein